MTIREALPAACCPLCMIQYPRSAMKRDWPIWIGFVLCLAIVLAAMGFISLTALRLDRADLLAEHFGLELTKRKGRR